VNRSANVVLEIMARSTKGGGDIEEHALGGKSIQEYVTEKATPGMWSVVADDAIAGKRIKEHTLSQFPPRVGRSRHPVHLSTGRSPSFAAETPLQRAPLTRRATYARGSARVPS
jgi:hypothetical protein